MSVQIEHKSEEKMDDDVGVVLTHILSPKKRLLLRVSSTTPVKNLAGSIYNSIMVDKRDVALTFMGAGSSIQALKALVVAQQMISPSGEVLFYRVCFEKDPTNLKPGDEGLSVMKILIFTMS